MAPPASGSIHVLHVDDEPDFSAMVAEFLTREDERFSVETATSAGEALEQLTRNHFDCVVSDYDMPGQDGIQFLEAVREENPDLPFVLYTGKGSEGLASEAISAGVTEYFLKDSGTDQYDVLANRIVNSVEKHRARQELQDREERLDLFFEQSPLGVIRWDDEFNFVRLNDTARDILGFAEGELVGQPWETVVPEADREEIGQVVVADLLADEGGYHSINENVRKAGDRIVCEWHNWVVTGEDDEVVAVFSQFQDITQRRARERELRETSRRLDLALEATETGVWEWDMETDEVVWSEALERLLGIEPGTFGGTYDAYAEYLHPDDIPKVEQAVEEALADDGVFHAEFRMIREDGEVIWVEGRGELQTENGSRRFIGTTTDVTDRKETEQALARRELLNPSVELEFRSEQMARPILKHTGEDLEFSLDGEVPGPAGSRLTYWTVRGATAKEVQAVLADIPTVGEVNLLSTVGDSARYQVTAEAGSIPVIFEAVDGQLQSITIEDETCKFVGEFPETVDPEAVAAAVRETYPDIELASRQRIVTPTSLRNLLEDDLTERQRTVLGTAYYSGYFEQPRHSTGEELASRLGITRQTFNSHLRKAHAKVYHALFEEAIELPT